MKLKIISSTSTSTPFKMKSPPEKRSVTTTFNPLNKNKNDANLNVKKHQMVSLNGDSVRHDSVEVEEALARDVGSLKSVKTKALCVHIRENKWYDAGNSISTGVAGSSLNRALESMSLAYNPATKQIFSLEEPATKVVVNGEEATKLSNGEETNKSKIEDTSANNSPRNSLPRSCSSTVSSLSEASPSGSFLGTEEQQTSPEKPKRWAFFGKSSFFWKNSRSSTPSTSPSRNINIGSLALIQQPRPANLPAKDAEEEERHRKQYFAMLEAARKKELKEEKERRILREQQLREEERLSEDSQIWNSQILPYFAVLRETKRVKELWWRGLPPSVRGRVWREAISNDLNVTPNLYNLCLDKIQPEILSTIKLDVSRTFPTLCVFQENGPLATTLQNILAAYAAYRPDVGYVQGMSFIGAILSLNMEAIDAFICFSNLLNRPCHRAAFTLDQKKMDIYYKVYLNALAYRLPKIHSHFTVSGLSPDLYLLDWLYTVYAKAMPLDVACRIWDMFLRDGDEFLFRTALGVLHLYQDELLKMDFVRGAQFLTRLPENLQSDALFNSIHTMSTSVGSINFQEMLKRCS